MEFREVGRAIVVEMGYAEMIVSVLAGGVVMVVVLYVYERLFMKPKRVRSLFEKQGIRGPSPSFFLGNIPQINNIQMMSTAKKLHNSSSPTKLPHHQSSFTTASLNHHRPNFIAHDWPSTIFSHLQHWQTQYGPNFIYSTGSIQLLCMTDPEMVKELGLCKSLSLGKPSYQPKERGPLLGLGIATSNGPIWAHQRKIIAPQFYLDKVKGMVNLMVDSTNSLITSWENKIKSQEKGIVEIKIDEDLKNLSADIISRACFGSNYSHGQQIFLKLRSLQNIMSKKFLGVPGSRLMPTKSNREMWRLEKEIRRMILELVKQREAETSNENDLLQMIMEGAKNYGGIDRQCLGMTRDKFIVDNCKTIYLAGHETIAITASWSLMLLAAYPEWQARARAEVLQVFSDGVPHADMLPSLKTLSMVIHETLRLYPPSVYVIREAFEDLKLKDIVIPKGTNIQIPIPILHRIPEIWGCDSQEFNPQRFENGILGASKIPQAYLPFGVGTRICVGQRLAHTQLKIILSLILSKFSFSLSPSYKHSLTYRLFIQPQHGINLHLRRL